MTERQNNGGTFELGQDLARAEPYQLSLESLMQTHTRVMGSTGSGKSRLLHHVARAIIRAGYPFVLIDGKGDLVDSVERDLAFAEAPFVGPERVAIIDPQDTQAHAPGFNPIALNGREPYARAKSVLSALMKVFHEEGEAKPWLREIMLNALVPLERAGLGILELATFLQHERFRDVILARYSDHWLEQFWAAVEDLPQAEKQARFSAAQTRGSLLWSSGEGIRRIFGQLEDSLDWGKILAPGGILLANANASRGVDSEAANFLGTICFQQLIETAARRPKHDRVPTFVMVDEFARFASSDVVEALELLRGFGVHLILAHQDLAQLEDVPRLLGAVDSCCQNLILFSLSAPDAERLQDQVFTGFRPDRGTLQELYGPVFAPRQRWVNVDSVAHHPSVSIETETDAAARYHPATRTRGHEPDGMLFSGDERGYTVSEPFWDEAPGTAGRSRTEAHEVRTRTPQLITEYEERSVLTSRQIETLEDLKEHGRKALMRQPRRDCTVQLLEGGPAALRVASVEDAPVSDQTLELWKHLIYRQYPRGEAIDQELATRRDRILENETPRYEDTRTTTLRIPKAKPSPPPAKRRRARHPSAPDHAS